MSARTGEGDDVAQDDEEETEIWTPNDEGQLSKEDTLDDRGLDDALDEGYSPPERPRGLDAFGTTAAEQQRGESFEQRLRQEEPDPTADPDDEPLSRDDLDDDEALSESDEFFDADVVGDRRAGRLRAPDEGIFEDDEKDEIAEDTGIDGGASSAEEAAIHIVEP
jgi:hypothetical protein